MHLLVALTLALGATALHAQPSSERGKVRLDVSLIGTAPAGSEGLGYFVGEVSRALGEALRRDGVGLSPNGDVAVVVTLEERPGDRVALTARARGHHVELEGTVESLDALVDELATRIVPLCPAPSQLADAPSHRSTAQRVDHTKVAALPAPATAPSPAPSTPPPLASAPPLPAPEAAPPVVAVKSPIADPYGPDARVDDASPAADHPTAFIRGRVVVHTLYDPADAPAGTGSMATQALYAVLQSRLHLAIVPMGAGISSSAVAADEGARAQARVVVMGRIDGFVLYMSQGGPVARMRLELTVVSEGRLVLRRTLYAETPMNAVAAAVAEGRRGRSIDPVFLAVTRALESELVELQVALLGPNNGGR